MTSVLQLPSAFSLGFALPLFLQTFLLVHPAAATNPILARIRFLLTFIIVPLALGIPFIYQFEPAIQNVGANFRYGIFGPFFALKSIEFGFAVDLSAYKWIGFLNPEIKLKVDPIDLPEPIGLEIKACVVLVSSVKAEGTRSRLNRTEKKLEKNSLKDSISLGQVAVEEPVSLLKVAVNAVHLLTSMRGIGYGFSPLLFLPPRPIQSTLRFFLATLGRLIGAHVTSTIFICLIVSSSMRDNLLLSLRVPAIISPYISTFIRLVCVGLSLHSNMNIGFEGTSLLYLVINLISRSVLPINSPLRPLPFDTREYPPLFSKDVYLPFKGVGTFWRDQWHALFSRVFTSVGYYPLAQVFGKKFGKILSLFTVFAMSAWFHQQAFYSANYHLPSRNLSLYQSQGANLFFLAQPIAILAETIFSKVTGKKIDGPFGLIWSYGIIVGIGLVAAQSWLAQGLVQGICDPSIWSIARFLIPNLSLLPC